MPRSGSPDTNVLIAYERGTIDRAALDTDELAVAAVSIAEYRVGIELADTPATWNESTRLRRKQEWPSSGVCQRFLMIFLR